MVINFDENSNKCNFTQCRCYEDGECLGFEERRVCLEMAFAVLGVENAEINQTGYKRESEV